MTSETGTRGEEIAAGLAEHLGLRFADQSSVEEDVVARLMEHEATHSLVAGFGAQKLQLPTIPDALCRRLLAAQIEELAAYGNVLLTGGSAVALLANKPHVVRVHLRAPLAARLTVLAARFPGAGIAQLCRMVETSDAALSQELATLRSEREPSSLYDLILEVGSISVEMSIDIVATLVGSRRQRLCTGAERLRFTAPQPRQT